MGKVGEMQILDDGGVLNKRSVIANLSILYKIYFPNNTITEKYKK